MNKKNEIFKEEFLECKCGKNFSRVIVGARECPKCHAKEGFKYIKGFLRARYPEMRIDVYDRIPVYNLCTLAEYKAAAKPEKFGAELYLKVLTAKTKLQLRAKRHKKVLTEASKHTVLEAITKYENDILSRRAWHTQVGFGNHLKFWKAQLGAKTLASLESDDAPLMIKRLRDSLASPKRSNTTLNRYLSSLSAVLGRCIKDFLWMKINPCSSIMKLEEPKHRIRYLSRSEQSRLLQACEGDLWDAVVLALKTGARKQEIWRLKFDNVDFKRKHILLLETKSGKPRSIPMTGDLMEILQRRRVEINFTSPYVFPSATKINKPYDFDWLWDIALKESEVTNFRWHDLRHTFASRAVMAGVSLRSLADLLGHSKIDMVFRYAHLSPQHLADSMELASEEIGQTTRKDKKIVRVG